MNRNIYEDYHKRYKHAITSQDDQRLWKMIDWSGNANVVPPKNQPSVQELSEHFIQLYEPIDQEESLDTLHTNVNIPLLDDPITPEEVYNASHKMKKGGWDYPITVQCYGEINITNPAYTTKYYTFQFFSFKISCVNLICNSKNW